MPYSVLLYIVVVVALVLWPLVALQRVWAKAGRDLLPNPAQSARRELVMAAAIYILSWVLAIGVLAITQSAETQVLLVLPILAGFYCFGTCGDVKKRYGWA